MCHCCHNTIPSLTINLEAAQCQIMALGDTHIQRIVAQIF